jgi:NAD dependent epimerase/dehydratase
VLNWKNKKVFVTGAGGFIGSRLCSQLVRSGARVSAMLRYSSRSDWGNLEFLPDNERAELAVVRGDVQDADFMERHLEGHDVVFHLAALIGIPYSYVAPASYLRTNVEGTMNVLEALRKCSIGRMVHTSTSEVYGTARYTPIDEEHPLQGQSPYSATKIAADKLVESYCRSFELPVATLRPFNTFGPGQSARAVIPTIISQALSGDVIRLGDLSPVRDLTYVDDTAHAFIRIAESDAAIGQVVNAGNGRGVTIGRLAALIFEIIGNSKEILVDPERIRPPASEVFELICDNARARELLGWQPQVDLQTGLARMVEFIRANPNFYNSGLYTV